MRSTHHDIMASFATGAMLALALGVAGCADEDDAVVDLRSGDDDDDDDDNEDGLVEVDPGPYGLGENPVWNTTTNCVVFADIHQAKILEYCPATEQTNVLYSGILAFGLTINDDGALIVGTPGGLFYVASPTDIRPLATVDPETNEPIFVNEQVSVNGGVYFGDVDFDGTTFGPGNLYWIDANGNTKRVASGRHLPNGLGISPDHKQLYFAASVDRKIYSFDIDASTGVLTNEKVFATLPASVGIFDGLTVDTHGDVYVAVWYGGQVRRYNKHGKLKEVIELPVLQPSNVTFGGPGSKDLYITSASDPFVNAMAPPGFNHAAPNLGGPLYRITVHKAGLVDLQSSIAAPPPVAP